MVTHAATCCRVRRHATPCDGVRRCTSSPPILPPPRCCDLAPSSCFVFLFGLRSSSSRSSSFFSMNNNPAQGNPPPPQQQGQLNPVVGGAGAADAGGAAAGGPRRSNRRAGQAVASGAPAAPAAAAVVAAAMPFVCVLCRKGVDATHRVSCPSSPGGLALIDGLLLGAQTPGAQAILAVAKAAVPPPPAPAAGNGAPAAAGAHPPPPKPGTRRGGKRAQAPQAEANPAIAGGGEGAAADQHGDDVSAEDGDDVPPITRGATRGTKAKKTKPNPPEDARATTGTTAPSLPAGSFSWAQQGAPTARHSEAVLADLAAALMKAGERLATSGLTPKETWQAARLPLVAAVRSFQLLLDAWASDDVDDDEAANLRGLHEHLWRVLGLASGAELTWDHVPTSLGLADVAGACTSLATAVRFDNPAPAPPTAAQASVLTEATFIKRGDKLQAIPLAEVGQVYQVIPPGPSAHKPKPRTVVCVAFREEPVPLSADYLTVPGPTPTHLQRLAAARMGLPVKVVADPTFQAEVVNDLAQRYAVPPAAAQAIVKGRLPRFSDLLATRAPSPEALIAVARVWFNALDYVFGRRDPILEGLRSIVVTIQAEVPDEASGRRVLAMLDSTDDVWNDIATTTLSNEHLRQQRALTTEEYRTLVPVWADVRNTVLARDLHSAVTKATAAVHQSNNRGAPTHKTGPQQGRRLKATAPAPQRSGGGSGGGGGGSGGSSTRPVTPFPTTTGQPSPSAAVAAAAAPPCIGQVTTNLPPETHPTATSLRQPGSSGRVCYNFTRGRCIYGAACIHKH